MQNDEQTRLQETQYSFPYHHIPTVQNTKFSSVRYWSWGFRYLGGIQLVLDQLENMQFSSLIDIGCGDGRLLREIASQYRGKHLLGIDASARAIQLAQAMNPGIRYQTIDLLNESIPEKFDVATLIEVIEHIPPDHLPGFMHAAADVLAENGRLILTVPHENTPVTRKHYQHFNSAKLRALLEPYFDIMTFIPFDVPASRSLFMWLIQRVLGPKGKFFILTNARLLYLFYAAYLKRYLYAGDEDKCERIAVICTKKQLIPS
jgi:2-polyprenyl-3-methyl-5-hydroxy-6-metoxy-1,4-benzoquinol methylase